MTRWPWGVFSLKPLAASIPKCNTPRIEAQMTEKKYKQLSERERHAIALGLQKDMSLSAIARALGRSKSTISRECQRNAGGKGYTSKYAQQRSDRRRRFTRPQPKLHRHGPLFQIVRGYLHQHWSPQQIAQHLKQQHPDDRSQRVSHESIYTCIYAQPRGQLKKELLSCLRMAHAKRWPRSKGQDRRGQIQDLLSIHVRPPEVEDRQLPGHWEGDLIKGANNASAIGTLVERTTRLVVLVKLPHPNPATAAHVLQAFTDKLNAIAQPMRQSLTYDRGREVAEPKAGEVLVRLAACGVCHTDLYTASGADPTGYVPCVLGHEGAGVVERIGEGRRGLVAPGD